MSGLDFGDEHHPIDIAEVIAEHHAWDFDRIDDDQIAMAVEGQWKTYSMTLALSTCDETLRIVCTYEMEPPEERLPHLFEILNLINDRCWSGAFTWWAEHQLLVYRYGLILAGTSGPSPEQIDTMLQATIMNMERYYPAIQLAVWSDNSPKEAMGIAIAKAYGRA